MQFPLGFPPHILHRLARVALFDKAFQMTVHPRPEVHLLCLLQCPINPLMPGIGVGVYRVDTLFSEDIVVWNYQLFFVRPVQPRLVSPVGTIIERFFRQIRIPLIPDALDR
jgi:hypothetical protein